MIYFGLFLYLCSLVLQTIATIVAIKTIELTSKFKSGWLIFSTGLLLMSGRRISPILHSVQTQTINITDAFLAVPISLFLALGVIQIRKAFTELNDKTQKLENSQREDCLTGAVSRPEMMWRAQREIERSLRTGQPISILMIDIDHFKKINDTYGHQFGDHVLKTLTGICQKLLRKIDTFSRYGGEEFLVLLPETDQKQARETAERLRSTVDRELHTATGLSDEKITISIGLSVYTHNTSDEQDRNAILNALIYQADKAMYQAKNDGRNRVSSFQ